MGAVGWHPAGDVSLDVYQHHCIKISIFPVAVCDAESHRDDGWNNLLSLQFFHKIDVKKVLLFVLTDCSHRPQTDQPCGLRIDQCL